MNIHSSRQLEMKQKNTFFFNSAAHCLVQTDEVKDVCRQEQVHTCQVSKVMIQRNVKN